ncbi:MAG: alpha/beta hydrolase [Caldilineaceae bacterium]
MSTNFLSINDTTLHYEERGSGNPLLFIHAGVADLRMWDEQVAWFAHAYRTIRFDMRGFGQSLMQPGSFSFHGDVVGVLDALGITKAILIGCSFGSLVALNVALDTPERVAGLILASPSVDGETPSERIRQFWRDEAAALETGDIAGATELNLRLWVDGPHRTPEQVDPDVREQVRTMQEAIFRLPQVEEVEVIELDPQAIERLERVTVPTLVIAGALDLEEKVALAKEAATRIPNAQYVEIAEAAHMVNMEQPIIFNQHVQRFIQELHV